MKKWGKLLLIAMLCCLAGAELALAGEAGTISCTSPGCGFQENFIIGGGMKSPSVTGYCPGSKKFVRVKLADWADYRKPQRCPDTGEPLQPVYNGSDVAKFPCPRCGQLTLQYQRRFLFD